MERNDKRCMTFDLDKPCDVERFAHVLYHFQLQKITYEMERSEMDRFVRIYTE